MPSLNRDQFWKANPNQMALPGMEDISPNPAAPHLARGYHVVAGHDPYDGSFLQIRKPGTAGARLDWSTLPLSNRTRPSGEIQMVKTGPGEERQGLATALYGIGRTMARVKPQHSVVRTRRGDSWALKASASYGGRVPKNDRW